MEITTRPAGDALELAVTGRLDAYWADHLARVLEEAVRDGADRIRLDLSGVSFISSVGLRVLIRFYKQLQGINGAFAVSNPSEAAKRVLELAGLEALLVRADVDVGPLAPRPASRALERDGARMEIFELARDASLRCRVVGSPERLASSGFSDADCRTIAFSDRTIGVGLGAFGHGFTDCQARFGEFLAVAGAAAYLPTDGTNVPDYLVATGALVPELQVLYALVCEGGFAALVRFEAPGSEAAVPLATLADACLEAVAHDSAGIVVVAESAGLVGAALRRSPAGTAAATPFAYPGIRDWLSFTPEREHPRSLALVVGVATRVPCAPLAPLVRPLGGTGSVAGHFHAAAFSYRPLPRGPIELAPTVGMLFQAETLQGVLHLLRDDRDIAGAGDSGFVRGACWVGPITEVVAR